MLLNRYITFYVNNDLICYNITKYLEDRLKCRSFKGGYYGKVIYNETWANRMEPRG